MKSSDFTLVLQQQLDVANETNRVLLARIDDLGKTIEELRTELAIANLKREELMSTITSMQEAEEDKQGAVKACIQQVWKAQTIRYDLLGSWK